MSRFLVIDDSELVRRGIVSVIAQHRGWEVVGQASNGIEAVDQAKILQPDVITLDISMPQLNGWEAARLIREVAPECRILFLSDHNGSQMAAFAVEAGGSGFICKSDAGRELISGIEAVLNGKTFVSSSCTTVDGDGTDGKGQAAAADLNVSLPRPKPAA